MEKIEKIEIEGKDNGICVKVGCKILVYQQKDLKQFFKDLGDYLKDPKKTKDKIYKRYGISDGQEGNFVMTNGTVWYGAVDPVGQDEGP